MLKLLRPAYYSKMGGLASDLLAFGVSEDTANVPSGTTVKLVKQDAPPLWGDGDGWWRLEFPNGDQVLEHEKALTHRSFFRVLLD